MSDTFSSGDFFSGDLSSTDSIVQIFTGLFGEGWQKIGLDAVMGAGAESSSMIISVLGAINVIALNAGALMLGWIALSATMGTAHEGQFLGKRFHDIWMPLRSGLSITLLAPVAKGGLCVVQVIGLIFIGFSIQFANYIQSVGLDFMLKNNGNVTLSLPPGIQQNAKGLASGLLKTLVVQHHAALNEEEKIVPYKFDDNFGYSLAFYGPNMFLDFRRPLSTVIISKPSTSSAIAETRLMAVKKMYETLDPLALSIVTKATAEYEDTEMDTNLFETSINNYFTDVQPELVTLLSKENPDYQNQLTTFVDKAKKDGVLWLGSYYHTMSRLSEKTHAIANDFPTFHQANLSGISDEMNVLLESALATVQTVEENFEESKKVAIIDQGPPFLGGRLAKFLDPMREVGIPGFVNAITDGDPLSNLADWGHGLMWAGEAVVGSYLIFYTGAETADGVANSGLGKAISLIPGAAIVKGAIQGGTKFLSKIWPLILFLAIPAITLGIMMAVYLPAVPYVIWMAAIIGCLILWIEFLVHMPVWSITFATGEGEGLAGQRSQQGLMLIANSLFRLPLMTAGFLIAVVIMPLIGKVIGATLLVMVEGMTAEYVVGIPTMLGIWFLFGGFTILQTHTVFGLVTHLPEGVMKFFGGAVTSMGEAQQEARTRNMIMASLSKGEGAGQNIVGKAGPSESANQKIQKKAGNNEAAAEGRGNEMGNLAPAEKL